MIEKGNPLFKIKCAKCAVQIVSYSNLFYTDENDIICRDCFFKDEKNEVYPFYAYDGEIW